MDTTHIRPIAICLFRNRNRILVSKSYDSIKKDYFYRPLGGGIEYGESSQVAVLREIQEELDFEVENLKLLGVLENIFINEGQKGHEIVFVFDAQFVNKSLYELNEIDYYEQGAKETFKAKWFSLDVTNRSTARLVPEGLTKLLHY